MTCQLILIDASNWLFRAFHALPPLTSPSGEPTGAVYGFGQMLKRLHKDLKADYWAVVFDASGESFRNTIFPAYKANRAETPPDLSPQFAPTQAMVSALGMPLIVRPGVEADDVIGTYARAAQERGWQVLIVSGDKDMAQLVSPQIHLLDTMKNRRMDPAGVLEKFGVRPDQIIDYLALMGDAADNIPGVPGVGEKTAAKLLTEYQTLAGVRSAAATIKGKLGENLRAADDVLPMCQTLATIRCDVDAIPALDDLQMRAPQTEILIELYQNLGFFRWAEDLGATPVSSATKAAAARPNSPTDATPPPAQPTYVLPAPLPSSARLITDAADFAALLATLENAALICFDTETDSLDAHQARLVGLAFAVEPGVGYYVPLHHDYMGAPQQLSEATVLAALKPLLESPHKPKVAQNGKFDCNVLAQYGITVQGLQFDTMLQSYVLDPTASRHDMDTLAEKFLGHKTITFADVTGKGKAQITFNQVELQVAADYSAEDADITLRLHHALQPQLKYHRSLLNVFNRLEMPLVPVLCNIEQAGVMVDKKVLQVISAELGQRMADLQAEAFVVAGGEFNLGSPKQLQTILYDTLKLPILGKTPKGDPSTAEDVLEELALQHALPRLILDWRSLAKLRSTYADTLPLQINPKTQRIHTSYHQAVAATGRLSSSDPNLQNIPVRTHEGRRIRQAFVAAPGNLLCSIDYSQIELRLMAHLSGDAKLQEAFNNGLDIHRAAAAEVSGKALDAVSSEERRAAKAINFGLIYGISAFGLAKQLGIGRTEAQATIDRFFSRYPGVKRYMEDAKESARNLGYVETVFGRRLYLPNIHNKNQSLRQYAERTAINAPLQGTAADLIKLAMIDLHVWLQQHAPQIRMIMQVHDELVFEGPADQITLFAPQLATQMVRVLHHGRGRPPPLSAPLVADYGIGSNWDAAHTAIGSVSS